jgi:hypothetical protein
MALTEKSVSKSKKANVGETKQFGTLTMEQEDTLFSWWEEKSQFQKEKEQYVD